ncbi:PilC/PilY family type IV pilus protein [Arenicella sp.]|nr:PilC/PilY family type IV pilus protein [Arenicella sp.]
MNTKLNTTNQSNSSMLNKIKVVFLSTTISIFFGYGNSAFSQQNINYTAVPISSEQTDPPFIMLSMSRDHQYFFKAYNDYTDLDPDGDPSNVDADGNQIPDEDADGNPIVETTYKHSFDYFGYFDSGKCYSHDGSKFVPQSLTGDKYCSGEWSGNFLNWMSMTRMDIVRAIMYGGKRSTDTDSETVLERAYLPTDAHSFAKYYNGDDLSQLTPYTVIKTDGTNGGNGDGFDDQSEGITFCSTTYDTGGSSQDSTNPPLIRVAEGNYQLWASNERWQCTWESERGDNANENNGPTDPFILVLDPINNPTDVLEFNSGIDAFPDDPPEFGTDVSGRTLVNEEMIARVEACVDGLRGNENCKQYPDGNYKPVGILQTYGDTGLINFGLMTGSYSNNIEGGVLRKNAGPFNDEVDVAGDGTFTFTDADDSIVKTLDKLRVWGYGYRQGTYRRQDSGGDNCTFQLATIPNGRCNAWGNPISEIYKETVRYLAGLNPDPSFVADDSGFISGLTTATFDNPLDTDTQCSDLNTIVINASVSSYDNNDTEIDGVPGGLDGVNNVAGGGTTVDWTDRVGIGEGLDLGRYFVGRTATDTDEFCTSKTIPRLSAALGLCPEAPTVLGSFSMAGIAYYAHNNDIRADLEGNQTLNTFAISLATNSPVISVPRTTAGAQEVTILPAYRLNDEDGGGALVDFKIVRPHTRIGNTNQFDASYYINWEDSEQGGDYDQDVWGTVDYILDEDANQITITTNLVSESTGSPQLYGFVTNGTTQDGFHALSGMDAADYTDLASDNDLTNPISSCEDCYALSEIRNFVNLLASGNGTAAQRAEAQNAVDNGQYGPQSHTFDIAASDAQNLESPLYYAAKYGGFTESTESDALLDPINEPIPDLVEEWDAVNNITGAVGPDGLPDSYFFVINPQSLFESLERTLQIILAQQERSNSSVANFTNADGFGNLLVQAGYQELRTDEDLTEVLWTGTFNSFFVDDFGYLREDNPTLGTQGTLDDYDIDRAFEYSFDETTEVTSIQYLRPRVDGGEQVFVNGVLQLEETGILTPSDEINFVWSADEVLSSYDNDAITEQRNYNTPAADGGTSRYIFTYVDFDQNGEVDGGEQFDFVSSLITPTNYQYFGDVAQNQAEDIVDFIRGYDDPDPASLTRNRRLLENGDEIVYRLGDIVNSTPAIVAQPTSNYDTIFGDTSYTAFRELYADRRTMVYVGANDGLLHAFNAGFTETDSLSVAYDETGPNGETAHQLGAEVWAYAPYNLLPHMQWLASNRYTHVFYVDGSPQIFEAKIFDDDATHPGGWGTVLVVNMRLGGGDLDVTLADNSLLTTRSAYIVMDVTDPEQPPQLLAEISHEDLNFTTAKPSVYYDCDSACSSATPETNFDGDWLLVFGSGPDDLGTFETSETAKIFTYDLKSRDSDDLEMYEVEVSGDTVPNSFIGGITTRDWDNGKNGYRDDDVLYFGTVGTEIAASPEIDGPDEDGRVETGAVYRFRPKNANGFSLLYDAQRPVSSPPLPLSNEEILPQVSNVLGSWVFFGTGVYQKQDDDFITDTERFYGIFEPVDTATLANLADADFDATREDSSLLTYAEVTQADLFDVTTINVLEGGALDPTIPEAETFTELREHIVGNTNGWYRDLPTALIPGDPSARLATEIASIQEFVLFTTFMPSSLNRDDICIGGDGESDLFFISQTTGTASGIASLGADDGTGIANASIDLGEGFASSPVLFTSESLGGESVTPIIRVDNGTTKRVSIDNEDSDGDGVDDDLPLKTGNATITRSGWRELF